MFGLMKTFRAKYPWVEILEEGQILVKAVPLTSKFSKRNYDSQYLSLNPKMQNLAANEMSQHDFKNLFLVDPATGAGQKSSDEWIIPEIFELLEDLYVAPSKYKLQTRPKSFHSINKNGLVYYLISKYLENFTAGFEVRQSLSNWRISLPKTPETLVLSTLDRKHYPELMLYSPRGPEPVCFNLMKDPSVVREIIWQYRMNQFQDFSEKWAIFCPKPETNSVKWLCEVLTDCNTHFKYEFKEDPNCYFVCDDTEADWDNGVENKITPKNNDAPASHGLAICFTKSESVATYLRLKFLALDIPTVVFKLPIGDSEDKLVTGHKMMSNVAVALGHNPWCIKQIAEPGPLMVLGIDVSYLETSQG